MKSQKKISYLMFADDCLIFCKATKRAARLKKDILHYSKVSGQLINYYNLKFNFLQLSARHLERN